MAQARKPQPKTRSTSGARDSAPSRSPVAPKTPILESSPFWLLKSEPETYSFETLAEQSRTNWNDVRNFQARNYLRRMKKGDIALIYHSGDEKAVVGVAKIVTTAYPDPEPEDPKTEWVQVDIEYFETFKNSVPLSTLKSSAALADLMLIRQSRLSVMPVEEKHYRLIRTLGGLKP